LFFMKPKAKFSQTERDEMIAFISRPTKRPNPTEMVQLIKAVEQRGRAVPCPTIFFTSVPLESTESGNGPYVSLADGVRSRV